VDRWSLSIFCCHCTSRKIGTSIVNDCITWAPWNHRHYANDESLNTPTVNKQNPGCGRSLAIVTLYELANALTAYPLSRHAESRLWAFACNRHTIRIGEHANSLATISPCRIQAVGVRLQYTNRSNSLGNLSSRPFVVNKRNPDGGVNNYGWCEMTNDCLGGLPSRRSVFPHRAHQTPAGRAPL
jgi:hypothetical protein